MQKTHLLWPMAVLAFLAGCSTITTTPERPAAKEKLLYEAVDFAAIPNIETVDFAPTLEAFKRSCVSLKFRKGWDGVCSKAVSAKPESAGAFFSENFNAYRLTVAKENAKGETVTTDTGLMTGYYEPLLYGSRVKTSTYKVPLLSVPDDLITVDLAKLYPQLEGLRLRGRLEGQKLVPYDSRAQITAKDQSRWAIAWVEDSVSAFFLQVQGSGRIVLPDGSYMRVGYADTNGHPYYAIGRWLIAKGYLSEHELSMQNIKAWAKKNPSRVKELLNQNPSYIYFTERQAASFDEGPVGAQGVPLTALGSVAVDRSLIALGTPLIVDVTQNNPQMAFTRGVVAQDTGGAIKGGLRFDYFWGFGDAAGEVAGRQKSEVRAWILLPKGMKPRA